MDISFLSRSRFRVSKLTLGYKVASERRRMSLARRFSGHGSVGFNAVGLGRSRHIQVGFIDSTNKLHWVHTNSFPVHPFLTFVRFQDRGFEKRQEQKYGYTRKIRQFPFEGWYPKCHACWYRQWSWHHRETWCGWQWFPQFQGQSSNHQCSSC